MSTWCRLFGTSHATTKALASASRSNDTEMKAKVVRELRYRLSNPREAGKIAARVKDFDRTVLLDGLAEMCNCKYDDKTYHASNVQDGGEKNVKRIVELLFEGEKSSGATQQHNTVLATLLSCSTPQTIIPHIEYQKANDVWYPHEPAGVPPDTGETIPVRTGEHYEYTSNDTEYARQFLKGYDESKAKEIMDALRTINPELWGRLTG